MNTVASYGRIARYPTWTIEGSWRMPRVDAGPWGFRAYAVLLWPEEERTGYRSQVTARSGSGSGPQAPSLKPHSDQLLLSLKTMNRDGEWTEFLPSPQKVSKYVPPHVDFSLIHSVVPQRVDVASRAHSGAPKPFWEFDGPAPLNWHRMDNDGTTTVELHSLPPGAVSLSWTGKLRGLLVLGRCG